MIEIKFEISYLSTFRNMYKFRISLQKFLLPGHSREREREGEDLCILYEINTYKRNSLEKKKKKKYNRIQTLKSANSKNETKW